MVSEADIMRVAILGSRGIPARYGGFETFAEQLSVRLVQQGMTVTVYCEAGEGEQPATYRGVALEYIPAPRLGPLTTIIFDLLCLWHARKAFDLVYMLGYGTAAFCFIPRLWGSKVWLNMDGVEWARSKWGGAAKLWFKLMEAVAMRTPDRLIADSEGILRHLQERYRHLPPASVIPYGAPVIHDPPDSIIPDEWGAKAGEYYLVVCRLEPENSVREIIQGYLRSGSPYPLILVGGLERVTPYVQGVLALSGDMVRFVGEVYDTERLQALRCQARGYFHGHTVGGTNPTLLEALGCGNLVIAHDNVYNREVAGEAASYFRQPDEVAECIRQLEAFPSQEAERRKNIARERIRELYSWELVCESYTLLLRTACPSRSITTAPLGEMERVHWI